MLEARKDEIFNGILTIPIINKILNNTLLISSTVNLDDLSFVQQLVLMSISSLDKLNITLNDVYRKYELFVCQLAHQLDLNEPSMRKLDYSQFTAVIEHLETAKVLQISTQKSRKQRTQWSHESLLSYIKVTVSKAQVQKMVQNADPCLLQVNKTT